MALGLFADQALTIKVTSVSPKRFLFSPSGGSRTSQLWIGDPYVSTCAVQANPGSNSIALTDTGEFLTNAQIAATSGLVALAKSGSQIFTYTGKTQSSLTGVSGITSSILVGDIVKPDVIYFGVNGSNLEAFPSGSDINNFGIRISIGSTSTLGFPGLPAIFPQTRISIGTEFALPVYISVTMRAGADQEFTNFAIQLNNVYKRDAADATAFGNTEATYSPTAPLYAYRHEEDLPIPIRILPTNRQVQADPPGFIIGQYRWRGQTDRNATALIPTHWDTDPNVVGLDKFIAGIGDQDDLTPVELVEVNDFIHMQVQRGEYFTGANRYYLPSNPVLEFLQTSLAAANLDGSITLKLQQVPRTGASIFVGTYILDNQQYYEKSIEYKYEATLLNPDSTSRTDLPDKYFTLDRLDKTLTLNTHMGDPLMFLGAVTGQPVDYFDLPVYPVDNVVLVYVDRGANASKLYATTWTFDREKGTLQVPNIPGSLQGQALFAIATPAVAVLYDVGPDEVQEIDTVDFNPAFSGLAKGYFYLQQRRQKPASLVLSADKPRISIPATQASIIGLVAYGPVYFQNDYALLTVTAYGTLTGETIPNAKLDVIVDPSTFTGLINYVNPLTTPVSVITGGDGTANLIFLPAGGFGVWIPTIAASGGLGGVATTNVANDSLVLPASIPLSQLWNPQEGWLVTTYTVANNDPLFGMVGGNPALGQIVFQTTGTPGAADYKTNGERDAWRQGGVAVGDIIRPIDAFDSVGRSYTNSLFNGSVKKLVYPTAVPIGGAIGAYFITFIQRVLIKLQLENSNLFSNSILLQMDTPNLILENPWLILNDQIQGRLNQYRLGYVPNTPI
jgi:hypothetical protein